MPTGFLSLSVVSSLDLFVLLSHFCQPVIQGAALHEWVDQEAPFLIDWLFFAVGALSSALQISVHTEYIQSALGLISWLVG